jgi:hypothetical protein
LSSDQFVTRWRAGASLVIRPTYPSDPAAGIPRRQGSATTPRAGDDARRDGRGDDRTGTDAGIERFGRSGVVSDDAGCGSYGLAEATPEHGMRMRHEVGAIGTMPVCRPIVSHLRCRGSGRIERRARHRS